MRAINLRCKNKVLKFKFLGEFKFYLDRQYKRVPLNSAGNYSLKIEKRAMRNDWDKPGIYAFATKNKKQKERYKYFGRASMPLKKRLGRYRSSGSTKDTTNKYVNKYISSALRRGEKVFIYFYPQEDIEYELQEQYKTKSKWNSHGKKDTN